MRRNEETLSVGARGVGGLGACLAALLGGLARHADDVGRVMLRCGDDIGRAACSQADDAGRIAFGSGDDLLRQFDDDLGRIRAGAGSGDDLFRSTKLQVEMETMTCESESALNGLTHRAIHQMIQNAHEHHVQEQKAEIQ